MVLKNITSKKEERVQVLNPEGISLKPRTRLRSKMQAEMELVHIPKNRNEYYGEIVMVNDSFSEETIHASKDQYCKGNENFIDIRGVAGSILEIFCTSK